MSNASETDPEKTAPLEPTQSESKIPVEVKCVEVANETQLPFGPNRNQREPPPPYYQSQQLPSQYYYHQDPSYNQRQTPRYQQHYGNVYGTDAHYTPPRNVSRNQPAHRAHDPEDQDLYRNSDIFTSSFNTVAIRNKFVRKVYGILTAQLVATFLFLLLVAFEQHLRQIFAEYFFPISIASMIVFTVVYIALVCCDNLRRNFPCNFILLGILTISMTLSTAVLVAIVSPISVLAAMGTTAIICFLVSIFACQTKWDVTGCGMCLMIATVVLAVYGLIIMILALVGIYIPILHIIFSAVAVLVFTFWLIYDTQMIMGGRRVELHPDEYIYGATQLYVDIMQIFRNILILYQMCVGFQDGH